MDLSTLAPSDAAVALRGFERRYRGLFFGLGEDESPEDLAHRPSQGWSAIEHIVAAAWAIAALERALAAVLTADTPTLDATDVDPSARPKPGAPTGTVHERIAELGIEANAMADRIERVPADDWARTGALLAVDAGVTHLRAAEQVLAAVRGKPIDPQA
jgi:hypothetical protein